MVPKASDPSVFTGSAASLVSRTSWESGSGSLQVGSDSLHIRHPADETPERPEILAAICGSRARADLLAALFAADFRWWSLQEAAKATARPRQVVSVDIGRLVAAGLLERAHLGRSDRYRPRVQEPTAMALREFVRQAAGDLAILRRIVLASDPKALAWIVGTGRWRINHETSPERELVVIAGPKQGDAVEAASQAAMRVQVRAFSPGEWVVRLGRRDLLVRRLRLTAKTWVCGRGPALVELERQVRAAQETVAIAVKNWREQLSDDWDEEWDPDLVEAAP